MLDLEVYEAHEGKEKLRLLCINLATEDTELVFPGMGKLEQERIDSRKENYEGRFGSPIRL